MNGKQREKVEIDQVQLVYASVLDVVSHIGMALIAAGFLIYVLKLLPLTVSIEDVAAHWHMRAADMNRILTVPSGWSWVQDPLHGDVLSYFSVVFLSMAAMICLVAVIPVFLARRTGRMRLLPCYRLLCSLLRLSV